MPGVDEKTCAAVREGFHQMIEKHGDEIAELFKMRDRLPNWAVILLSTMTMTVGYLLRLVQAAGGGS